MLTTKQSSKSAGFILSTEALLAVAAFSLTSAVVLNLLYRGMVYSSSSSKHLAATNEIAPFVYCQFISPEHNIYKIAAKFFEHNVLIKKQVAETSKLAPLTKYLSINTAYNDKEGNLRTKLHLALTDKSQNLGPLTKLDSQDKNSITADSLAILLPDHKDEDKEIAAKEEKTT